MSGTKATYFMHGALPAGDEKGAHYGEGTMKGEGIEHGWCVKDTRAGDGAIDEDGAYATDSAGDEDGVYEIDSAGDEDGAYETDSAGDDDGVYETDSTGDEDGVYETDDVSDGDGANDGDGAPITAMEMAVRRHLHPAAFAAYQILHHYGCASEANFNYPAFMNSQTAITRGLPSLDMGPIKAITPDCVVPLLIAGKLQKRILAAFASSYTRIMKEINIDNGVGGRALSFPAPGCMWRPSDTEIHRITLSLCQVDAYLEKMEHHSHKSLKRAEKSAATFFMHMTPWEKERIVTILELLSLHVQRDLYYLSLQNPSFKEFLVRARARLSSDAKFKVLHKHLLAVPGSHPTDNLTSKLLSRVASFAPTSSMIRNLTTKDTGARIKLYKKRFRGDVPWSVLLEHFIHQPVAGCESNETTDSDSVMTFVNDDVDPDKGPSDAWRAVNAQMTSPYWVGMDKFAAMRHLGYVFWDAERKPLAWVTDDNGYLIPGLTESKPFGRFNPFGV